MLVRFLALLAFSLLPNITLGQGPQSPSVELGPGDIYRMSSPAVVLIETYGEDGKVSGAGSGFLVSSDGRILTNYHVIAHTKRATVRLANDDAYDFVAVLDIDKRKDIALVKIKAVNQPHLKIGHSNAMQIGDKLYTLGNPLGVFQNTLSDGILSGIRQMDGYKLFQLSAPISHGSSGSPVFNSNGEVIAIVESTLTEGQSLNFAVPIDYAVGMLDSKELRYLESIYEPEEPKNIASSKPATIETKKSPEIQPTPAAVPSEAIKTDLLVYLSNKIGVWTKEDAELELGPPQDRRDGIFNASVISDIYKYTIPYSGFGVVELNINRSTKKLSAIYLYYRNTVSWQEVRKIVGKNYSYKKQKLPKGMAGEAYLYQFGARQLQVLVDSADNVRNVGVW